MTPHLPCAAVDAAWRLGGSRRINCEANQCQSRLRVWIRPSLVKSIYSRVRTEPEPSVRHVRRLCCSYIFLIYRAHSRRAPPKPVIDLLYLISIIISASINQKKQQRRKRSFMKRQANAVRSSNLAFNIEMQNPDLARKANHCWLLNPSLIHKTRIQQRTQLIAATSAAQQALQRN